ncbi:hypothetical protein TVAGG3_0971300 [Trichomonas vaginalis G3]|uniref:hypothetical protein n=1 Tax=Trichomonas vaginalis (strain ATCC PRA-98 / G3) TaxID=412133 RepID=UPI0021E5CDEE|nr:hypothetical protein TVAGG3_0971300 [Trichomonas vaginalis G3]KAI5488603.1 hypothetical protein TVAGG3_0971300 [Trichomonas vaginalis G3]
MLPLFTKDLLSDLLQIFSSMLQSASVTHHAAPLLIKMLPLLIKSSFFIKVLLYLLTNCLFIQSASSLDQDLPSSFKVFSLDQDSSSLIKDKDSRIVLDL